LLQEAILIKKTTYTGSGCDRVSDDQYFSQKYTEVGIGFGMTKDMPYRNEVIRYGVNVFLGDYSQIRQTDNKEVSKFLFGINPYIKYDIKWIGTGFGLHLGNLAYSTGDTHKATSSLPHKSYFQTPVFQQFYFRLGQQKYFFVDLHIADQFPVSSPGLTYQTGIGTGFGLDNGLNLRFGASFLEDAGIYISACLPIENRIVFEPVFLRTGKEER